MKLIDLAQEIVDSWEMETLLQHAVDTTYEWLDALTEEELKEQYEILGLDYEDET